MKLEGEHVFKGPRSEVWEMFLDPEVLGGALPGSKKMNKLSETEYEAVLDVRVGPVSGSFSGKLVMTDVNAPESCTLNVDGKGAPGFVKGLGHVHFTDQGDGTTLLKYDGEMQIGGTLASVGQRMLDSVAKSMVRQGFESLDGALEARLAAKEGRQVEYKPPTETDFAAGVAKDMAKGVMDVAETRMLMYIIPVALVLVVVAFVLSKCNGG